MQILESIDFKMWFKLFFFCKEMGCNNTSLAFICHGLINSYGSFLLQACVSSPFGKSELPGHVGSHPQTEVESDNCSIVASPSASNLGSIPEVENLQSRIGKHRSRKNRHRARKSMYTFLRAIHPFTLIIHSDRASCGPSVGTACPYLDWQIRRWPTRVQINVGGKIFHDSCGFLKFWILIYNCYYKDDFVIRGRWPLYVWDFIYVDRDIFSRFGLCESGKRQRSCRTSQTRSAFKMTSVQFSKPTCRVLNSVTLAWGGTFWSMLNSVHALWRIFVANSCRFSMCKFAIYIFVYCHWILKIIKYKIII